MNKLFIRKSDQSWSLVRDFPTYREALLCGQELAPFNFTIDTGERKLSREEQLGEAVTARPKTKKQKILESI